MRVLAALTIAFAFLISASDAFAQCFSSYGVAVPCNNTIRGTTVGPNTYFDNGVTAQRVGPNTYYNNGLSSQTIGPNTYFNNGGTAQQQGNTLYYNNPRSGAQTTCRTIGFTTYCDPH
jgi:hypothetical protein